VWPPTTSTIGSTEMTGQQSIKEWTDYPLSFFCKAPLLQMGGK